MPVENYMELDDDLRMRLSKSSPKGRTTRQRIFFEPRGQNLTPSPDTTRSNEKSEAAQGANHGDMYGMQRGDHQGWPVLYLWSVLTAYFNQLVRVL